MLCYYTGSDEQYDLSEPVIKKTVPVVGLLVQGSPRGVDHVLTYLTNKMPVVLLKGSGGVADLLAYAFEELLERWALKLVMFLSVVVSSGDRRHLSSY